MLHRRTIVAWLVTCAALAGVTVGVPPAAAAPLAPAPAAPWVLADRLGLSADRDATACGGPTDCWAVTGGKLLHTVDLGNTWSDRGDLVPSAVRGLVDVSCPTRSRCVVTGFTDTGSVVLVLDGGGVVSRPLPGAAAALRLDCPTAVTCLATDGTAAYRTADAGRTWAHSSLPQPIPDAAVSCAPGTSTCVVVGSLPHDFRPVPVVVRTSDVGGSWRTLAVPDAYARDTQLDDVDCVTAVTCRIAGGSGIRALVLTTTRTGIAPTAAALPRSVDEVLSISCTADTVCRGVARGSNGDQRDVRTVDGTHWNSVAFAPGYLADPIDIACHDGTNCVAVTTGLAHRSVTAAAWSAVDLPAALRYVTGLSCANVAPCVGVGYDAANRPVALRGAPGAWVVTRMPAAVGSAVGVDCATATVCTVLAQAVVPGDGSVHREPWRTTDGGATWTPQTFPEPSTGFDLALDCPSTSTCLALGFTRDYEPDLLRTVDGGGTWTRVAAPAGARDVRSVSCTSPTSCVILGRREFSDPTVAWRTTDLGATVSPPASFGGSSDAYTEVACRATTCVATGRSGSEATFARSADRGRTWAVETPPVAGLVSLSRLACTTAGHCAAISTDHPHPNRPFVSDDGGVTWRGSTFPGDLAEPGVLGCLDTGCFTVGAGRGGRPVVIAEPRDTSSAS